MAGDGGRGARMATSTAGRDLAGDVLFSVVLLGRMVVVDPAPQREIRRRRPSAHGERIEMVQLDLVAREWGKETEGARGMVAGAPAEPGRGARGGEGRRQCRLDGAGDGRFRPGTTAIIPPIGELAEQVCGGGLRPKGSHQLFDLLLCSPRSPIQDLEQVCLVEHIAQLTSGENGRTGGVEKASWTARGNRCRTKTGKWEGKWPGTEELDQRRVWPD